MHFNYFNKAANRVFRSLFEKRIQANSNNKETRVLKEKLS